MAQRQQIGFRATQDVAERLRSFAEDRDLNISQATETLVDDALRSRGYTGGRESIGEQFLRELGKAMLIVGATMWAMILYYQLDLRHVAVSLTVMGVVLVGLSAQFDRVRGTMAEVIGS